MKRLLHIVYIFIFIACSHQNVQQNIESFPVEKVLRAEKMPLSDIINPDFILLSRHNLFIIDTKNDSMLYQYSLPELNRLYKGGIKGQGKDEFQAFPMFCRATSERIYIWGFTPLTIRNFHIDNASRLSLEKNYQLSNYESFNQMHIVKDSILIYNAIPDELAIKKINLNNNKEIGRISFEPDDHQEPFFYKNRGILATNDSVIVYAYLYKRQIDLYTVDGLKLYKRLEGDDIIPNITVGDFENNTNYYINLIAGKRYFYALCQEKEKKTRLEIFDYNGHSIARYEFDIIPNLFDVDETTKTLYGYNSNVEDFILKYTL